MEGIPITQATNLQNLSAKAVLQHIKNITRLADDMYHQHFAILNPGRSGRLLSSIVDEFVGQNSQNVGEELNALYTISNAWSRIFQILKYIFERKNNGNIIKMQARFIEELESLKKADNNEHYSAAEALLLIRYLNDADALERVLRSSYKTIDRAFLKQIVEKDLLEAKSSGLLAFRKYVAEQLFSAWPPLFPDHIIDDVNKNILHVLYVDCISQFPIEEDPVDYSNIIIKGAEIQFIEGEWNTYRLRIGTNSSLDPDKLELEIMATDLPKNVHILVISGHGSLDGKDLSFQLRADGETFTVNAENLAVLRPFIQRTAQNGVIILDSCCLGKGGGLAEVMANYFDRDVYASPSIIHGVNHENGKISFFTFGKDREYITAATYKYSPTALERN